jgi:hypothetical protein
MYNDSIWYMRTGGLYNYEWFELRHVEGNFFSGDYNTGDVAVISWTETRTSPSRIRASADVNTDQWCVWEKRGTKEFDTRMSELLGGAQRIEAGDIVLIIDYPIDHPSERVVGNVWMTDEVTECGCSPTNRGVITLRDLPIGVRLGGRRLRDVVKHVHGEVCIDYRHNTFLGTWRVAVNYHCEEIRKLMRNSPNRGSEEDGDVEALFTYLLNNRYQSMLSHLQVGCFLLGTERGLRAVRQRWDCTADSPTFVWSVERLIKDMKSETEGM